MTDSQPSANEVAALMTDVTDAGTQAPVETNWALPVGVDGKYQFVYLVRSQHQRATVCEIAARDDFAYANDNPFAVDVAPGYTGPFSFVWTDTAGALHVTRIGKRGNILRETIAE